MSWRYGTCGLILLAVTLITGCDPNSLMPERTGGPVGNDAQSATDLASGLDGSGSTPPAAQPTPPAPAAPANNSPPENPAPQPNTPAPSENQSNSHVGKDTNEVLNAKELANDPNWKVAASDPTQVRGFSAAGTAYNRAAALGGTANLEKWLEMEQALNGQFPTYDQLQAYIAQNPPQMPALRVYQHYGYDESSGQIVILENEQERQKRHNELGIE